MHQGMTIPRCMFLAVRVYGRHVPDASQLVPGQYIDISGLAMRERNTACVHDKSVNAIDVLDGTSRKIAKLTV